MIYMPSAPRPVSGKAGPKLGFDYASSRTAAGKSWNVDQQRSTRIHVDPNTFSIRAPWAKKPKSVSCRHVTLVSWTFSQARQPLSPPHEPSSGAADRRPCRLKSSLSSGYDLARATSTASAYALMDTGIVEAILKWLLRRWTDVPFQEDGSATES
jgi:hypothetical protein